jgi:hypothetical protein
MHAGHAPAKGDEALALLDRGEADLARAELAALGWEVVGAAQGLPPPAAEA